MSLSVLGRAKPSDVCLEPFPHIIINDALPNPLYEQLDASFPSEGDLGVDLSSSNHRWNYYPDDVSRNHAIAAIWKEMIAYHVSGEFFQEIANLFFDGIHSRYPLQFPSRAYMATMRSGVRRTNDFRSADVLMDAMISGNTPTQSASSVRTTHVDQGRKLFSGLFYMRRADDDSVGGDLTISRLRQEFHGPNSKIKLFRKSYIDDRYTEVVKTVPYARNTLVLFINSLESFHGVTVRQPTRHGRYFVNLVGEVNPRLYRVPKLFEGAGSYGRLLRPAGEPRPLPIRLYEKVLNL